MDLNSATVHLLWPEELPLVLNCFRIKVVRNTLGGMAGMKY